MKSFCGLRLHTGGTLVGWLFLVCSILMTAYFTYILVVMKTVLSSYGHSRYPEENSAILSSIVCGIAYSVLYFIASVFLLLGIRKQNHMMLLPCLVNFAIDLISFVVFKIFMWQEYPRKTSKVIAIASVVSILIYAFLIYSFLGILSLYKHYKHARDEKLKNKMYGFIKV